jgi:hypothetical protein
MGFFKTISSPFARMFTNTPSAVAQEQRAVNPDARLALYRMNAALYDNNAYATLWTEIKSQCFPKCDPMVRVFGQVSPFKEIVEAYQNCMPGTYGNEIKIADKVDEKDVNPKLSEPVRTIWRDSNLDSDKATIQRHAANLGTVGMRPTVVNGKVVIQHDHPERIFDVEQDAMGNVVSIVLKYESTRNVSSDLLSPDYQKVDVVEIITKDEFSQTFDGVEQLTQQRNQFGFCPYVILRHVDNGTLYGDWAYKGTEHSIHQINFRISQQGRSIGRNEFPKWFAAAGGPKPKEFDVDGGTMAYVEMRPDSPPPLFQAIVPAIDQASAMAYWMEERDMLRGRQPELTIRDVKLLASVSGEAILRALTPAKMAILGVRPNYDHAFRRAVQMAISIGCDLGLWDVGTGKGIGAGDGAYRQGLEAFEWAPRPALPETPQERLAIEQAATAGQQAKLSVAKQTQGLGVSADEVLRQAGYSDQEIAAIKAEKTTKDVVPDQNL